MCVMSELVAFCDDIVGKFKQLCYIHHCADGSEGLHTASSRVRTVVRGLQHDIDIEVDMKWSGEATSPSWDCGRRSPHSHKGYVARA